MALQVTELEVFRVYTETPKKCDENVSLVLVSSFNSQIYFFEENTDFAFSKLLLAFIGVSVYTFSRF